MTPEQQARVSIDAARVTICTIQHLFSMLKLRANIAAMEFQRI